MSKKKSDKASSDNGSVQLSSYLNALPRPEMMVMITRIADGCMVPRYTVLNWKYGVCRIPALHRCKIEEIIGERIFNQSF